MNVYKNVSTNKYEVEVYNQDAKERVVHSFDTEEAAVMWSQRRKIAHDMHDMLASFCYTR